MLLVLLVLLVLLLLLLLLLVVLLPLLLTPFPPSPLPPCQIVTKNAINTLRTVMAPAYKKSGTNFALFLGLHFPHQSWKTPQW